MPDKYLRNEAGTLAETVPADSSAGVGDAGKIVALNADGEIDVTMLPSSVGLAVYEIEASQNLDAGDFVNIFDDTGAKVRKADASDISTKAHGFVLEAVTSGNDAQVYTDFKNNQLTSLTPGVTYFLSATTPGEVTATAPSDTDEIVQRLGVAVNATTLDAELGQPIIIA